jgi:hypothetical protein
MTVPLVNELAAIVLERLDIAATRAQDPPGDPSVGYSPEQRAPYVFVPGGGAELGAVGQGLRG